MINCDILVKLFEVKKDDLGAEHYNTYLYHYQSVKEQFPDLTQEEFREMVLNLVNNGYVKADVRNSENGIFRRFKKNYS